MSKAVICPVCNGSGRYAPLPNPYISSVPMSQTCHGCGGKGWVEVGDCAPYVPPVPYTPNPPLPGTTWPFIWPWGTITICNGGMINPNY